MIGFTMTIAKIVDYIIDRARVIVIAGSADHTVAVFDQVKMIIDRTGLPQKVERQSVAIDF
jgi:hypothetical protein